MITTVATAAGTIHARENHPYGRTVCGKSTAGSITLRRSDASDAYITCKPCAARVAAGSLISAKTTQAMRLKGQLSEPMAGARP